MKIPTEEKILEMRGDPGDQSTAWRPVLGNDQGPWLLTPESGAFEQWQTVTRQRLLPVLPWPAATSLWEGTVRLGECSASGEGKDKCGRK